KMLKNLKLRHGTGSTTFSLFVPAFFNAFVGLDFLKSKAEEALYNPVYRDSILSTVFGEAPEENELEVRSHSLVSSNNSLPRYVVPEGGRVTACGVDVDRDRIYYVVVSTDGAVINVVDFDCIKTSTGLFSCFNILERILKNNFRLRSGGHIPIRHVLVDSRFNEVEVHAACTEFSWMGLYGYSGMRKFNEGRLRYDDLELEFGEKNRCSYREKRKVKCITVDVNYYKSLVYNYLLREKVFLFDNVTDGARALFYAHITSEERLNSGKWKVKPGHDANHYWDALCYSVVLPYVALQDTLESKVKSEGIITEKRLDINNGEVIDLTGGEITREITTNKKRGEIKFVRYSTRPILTRY
ncbi:MAG: terminase gpA endonuclease subunit, partial [candidate division WOR-3 bacterium]